MIQSRLIAQFDQDDVQITTVCVEDETVSYETAVHHPFYGGGRPIPVQEYACGSAAMQGHIDWVQRMTQPPLPVFLRMAATHPDARLMDKEYKGTAWRIAWRADIEADLLTNLTVALQEHNPVLDQKPAWHYALKIWMAVRAGRDAEHAVDILERALRFRPAGEPGRLEAESGFTLLRLKDAFYEHYRIAPQPLPVRIADFEKACERGEVPWEVFLEGLRAYLRRHPDKTREYDGVLQRLPKIAARIQ